MAGPAENQESRSRIPDRIVRVSLRHPWGIIATWFALVSFLTPGLTTLQIETSTDSVLDRSHPDWSVYQEAQNLFGSDEVLVVALTGDRPLDPATLELIETLTEVIINVVQCRVFDHLEGIYLS